MKQKRSILIRPINICIDICIIFFVVFYVSDIEYLNLYFLTYITFAWLFIAYYTSFYNVYRYTHLTNLVGKSLSQTFVFALAYLSYFSIFKEGQFVSNQILVFSLIIGFILFFKLTIFILLKKYRAKGRNFRNVVLFGEHGSALKLEELFDVKNDLGYRFYGFFSDIEYKSKLYLGQVSKGFNYIIKNNIDEVYCDPFQVSPNQLQKIRNFVENNDLELRFIPENKAIYSKGLVLEYYGTVPILKPKPLPFERIETKIVKRAFDIFFSVIVFIFFISWIVPLLFIIIKIDSKGPTFFKQKRDGLNGKQFYCYKFRSMSVNAEADLVSATKNDQRVTRVGAFLRRTSLDELPQFFNVLKGEMSIVGPRPHINVQTKKYTKEIGNYLMRHSVKPGITGLAQISGYRGEVKKRSDIQNRVKLDIFYIENWSFFLDMKIIFQTFFKVFTKEENAY